MFDSPEGIRPCLLHMESTDQLFSSKNLMLFSFNAQSRCSIDFTESVISIQL